MDKSPLKAQNIIAMSDYQPETGYAAIAQVEAYWEALRGDRLLPKRSEVDPRGIEQSLENAFILERISAGVARLRIAGSHLNDLMGMEVRGMPLTALFVPSARRVVATLLEDVFQTPAVSTLNLGSVAAPQRPAVAARMVLLPLKSDLGDTSRILGSMVAIGDSGVAPRRFDIVEKHIRPIAAGGSAPVRRPDPAPSAPVDHLIEHGFAEEQSQFASEKKERRPPYLRLVRSEGEEAD